MKNLLNELNVWYKSKCDGVWEHEYGIKIETSDNPGWSILISGESDKNVIDFFLERNDDDYISVRADNNTFWAFGGVGNLDEILKLAIDWIHKRDDNKYAFLEQKT